MLRDSPDCSGCGTDVTCLSTCVSGDTSSSDATNTCIAGGNNASAPIDAQIVSLTNTWNPTGYYTTDAIRQGVAAVQAVLSSAFNALSQAQTSCAQAPGCSFPTWGDRYDELNAANNQASNYTDAATQADTQAASALQTAYVSAPGFKQWVLSAFSAASDAITDSYVTMCIMPWWASAVVAIQNAVASAAAVLGNILGVTADVVNTAYQAGKAAVVTAVETVGLAAWVLGNLPLLAGVAVLLFGGAYAYKNRAAIKARVKTMTARPRTA